MTTMESFAHIESREHILTLKSWQCLIDVGARIEVVDGYSIMAGIVDADSLASVVVRHHDHWSTPGSFVLRYEPGFQEHSDRLLVNSPCSWIGWIWPAFDWLSTFLQFECIFMAFDGANVKFCGGHSMVILN